MPTDWLRVMLEEITRKRDEDERARLEAARRATEIPAPNPPQPTPRRA